MKVIAQHLDDILATLKPLKVEWQDETARRVIGRLAKLPRKKIYATDDVERILDTHFNDGLLISRLFLALSKDEFSGVLKSALGGEGSGITRYKSNKKEFIDALVSLGLLEAIALHTSRKPKWTDMLVERLRSGRGSAISGQKRGRGVEDYAESVVKAVFGDSYAKRCSFVGARQKTAKCDFAVPSRTNPQIVIEAKGYAATGSKMTDSDRRYRKDHRSETRRYGVSVLHGWFDVEPTQERFAENRCVPERGRHHPDLHVRNGRSIQG